MGWYDYWEYEGSLNVQGYGVCWDNAKKTWKRVHRLVFIALNGYTPQVVRHTCDNRACYNPAHLLPGTPYENTRDMVERGRHGNLKKTHCANGHPFNEANTLIRKSGRRRCRLCDNAYLRRRRVARRQMQETRRANKGSD